MCSVITEVGSSQALLSPWNQLSQHAEKGCSQQLPSLLINASGTNCSGDEMSVLQEIFGTDPGTSMVESKSKKNL